MHACWRENTTHTHTDLKLVGIVGHRPLNENVCLQIPWRMEQVSVFACFHFESVLSYAYIYNLLIAYFLGTQTVGSCLFSSPSLVRRTIFTRFEVDLVTGAGHRLRAVVLVDQFDVPVEVGLIGSAHRQPRGPVIKDRLKVSIPGLLFGELHGIAWPDHRLVDDLIEGVRLSEASDGDLKCGAVSLGEEASPVSQHRESASYLLISALACDWLNGVSTEQQQQQQWRN